MNHWYLSLPFLFDFWEIFHVFCRLLIFSIQNQLFWKKIFQEYDQSVKQIGSGSGLMFCPAWSGSNLFAKVISRRVSRWRVKCSCSAIQWGYMSRRCAKLLSSLRLCKDEQWRFWRDCVNVQACQCHRWSLIRLATDRNIVIVWRDSITINLQSYWFFSIASHSQMFQTESSELNYSYKYMKIHIDRFFWGLEPV